MNISIKKHLNININIYNQNKFYLYTLLYCCLSFSNLPSIEASCLVLVNSQVPVGRTIAEQYRQIHQLKDLRIVEVSVEPLETVSWTDYKSNIETPLKAAIGDDWPEWLLTIYGMPLMVESEGRLRSLDQCLVLMRHKAEIKDKLVLSPLFFKENSDQFTPLPVCRLDAPALRQLQQVLESWAQLHNWGSYRRYFPIDRDIGLGQRLKTAGLWVQPIADFSKVRLVEVQLLQGVDQVLSADLKSRPDTELFAPGALVFRQHNTTQSDLPFRGNTNTASLALAHGAAFYVGALAPKTSEEDLFDPEIFAALYLKGENFINSVYAATPILGGSLLICGDPLASPFSKIALEQQSTSFMGSQADSQDPHFAKKLNLARVWWMLHDYLDHWERGRYEMVVQLLKVAIQRRSDSLLLECLARSYRDLDRNAELQALWESWPEAQKGDWERYLWEQYWSKVPK